MAVTEGELSPTDEQVPLQAQECCLGQTAKNSPCLVPFARCWRRSKWTARDVSTEKFRAIYRLGSCYWANVYEVVGNSAYFLSLRSLKTKAIGNAGSSRKL